VIGRRDRGIGGYPIGSIDPVLALISGGFDSIVASYLTMREGS
jgi:thiamine biosynthesis protein ThiI